MNLSVSGVGNMDSFVLKTLLLLLFTEELQFSHRTDHLICGFFGISDRRQFGGSGAHEVSDKFPS